MALVGSVERLAQWPVPVASLVPPHGQHPAGAKRTPGNRAAAVAIDPMPSLRGDDQVKPASLAAPLLERLLVDLDGQPLTRPPRDLRHRLIRLKGRHLEAAARELDGRLARPGPGLKRALSAIYECEDVVVKGSRVAGAPALV